MSKKTAHIILILLIVAGLGILAGGYYKKVQIEKYKAAHYGAEPIEPMPMDQETRDLIGSTGPMIEFGKPHIMSIGQETTFEDGFTIRLESIGDSRCKPGHQCFWEGELNPTFEVSTDGQKTWQDVNLGSVRTKSASVGRYNITLLHAEAGSATITIIKK